MKYMMLSDNQFTGSIPASMGNMETLEVLSIYHNTLTGEAEPICSGSNDLYWLATDCSSETSSCTCCDKCCSGDDCFGDDTWDKLETNKWDHNYSRAEYAFNPNILLGDVYRQPKNPTVQPTSEPTTPPSIGQKIFVEKGEGYCMDSAENRYSKFLASGVASLSGCQSACTSDDTTFDDSFDDTGQYGPTNLRAIEYYAAGQECWCLYEGVSVGGVYPANGWVCQDLNDDWIVFEIMILLSLFVEMFFTFENF